MGVSDLSKIQFWKQITTIQPITIASVKVFQTYQRYNFESKSQPLCHLEKPVPGVSDLSKIQFWKQITTPHHIVTRIASVFQTYQRYNFESKSQRTVCNQTLPDRCFRPIKDTILKANHNGKSSAKLNESGVSDLSKIQFWKQITTGIG